MEIFKRSENCIFALSDRPTVQPTDRPEFYSRRGFCRVFGPQNFMKQAHIGPNWQKMTTDRKSLIWRLFFLPNPHINIFRGTQLLRRIWKSLRASIYSKTGPNGKNDNHQEKCKFIKILIWAPYLVPLPQPKPQNTLI